MIGIGCASEQAGLNRIGGARSAAGGGEGGRDALGAGGSGDGFLDLVT